jgi:inosose dehydratase
MSQFMSQKRTLDSSAHTRRRFLQAAGLGAAALASAGAVPAKALAAENPSEPAGTTRAKSIPLGLASYTLRKFPLPQALSMTQRVGLKYLCLKSDHLPLDSKPEDIAAAAAKIKAAGIELYGAGVITMNNKAQVDQAFDYAKAAGMKTIMCAPVAAMLPIINEKVQQYEIAAAVHNHGPGDNNFPSPESVFEKIKDLDKRVGLCIDVGHTLRIGADPIRDAERFASRLLDLHIKDITAARRDGKDVEVGRGVIDIPRLLETLIKTQYAGIVSFEYEKDPDDPLPGLAESVGYVRGALAGLRV